MSLIYLTYSKALASEVLAEISYEWDEWACASYFHFIDEGLALRLAGVSPAAIAGLALAISEWICARFQVHSGANNVVEYIDAAWADLLAVGTCDYVEFDTSSWSGPVTGALRLVQLIAVNTLYDAKQDEAYGARACWAYNLARHVLPAPATSTFESWITVICERLNTFHPDEVVTASSLFDREFPPPRRAPPVAFCHQIVYDLTMADRYMAQLSSSPPPAGRYLRPRLISERH
jgi:hypothetical protein